MRKRALLWALSSLLLAGCGVEKKVEMKGITGDSTKPFSKYTSPYTATSGQPYGQSGKRVTKVQPTTVTYPDFAEPNSDNPGEPYEIEELVVPGKTTVIEFTSPYCGPCMMVMPALRRMTETRKNFVIRALNINRSTVRGVDFESPLALQYKIMYVPQFRIYGPDGNLIAEDRAATQKIGDYLDDMGKQTQAAEEGRP